MPHRVFDFYMRVLCCTAALKHHAVSSCISEARLCKAQLFMSLYRSRTSCAPTSTTLSTLGSMRVRLQAGTLTTAVRDMFEPSIWRYGHHYLSIIHREVNLGTDSE